MGRRRGSSRRCKPHPSLLSLSSSGLTRGSLNRHGERSVAIQSCSHGIWWRQFGWSRAPIGVGAGLAMTALWFRPPVPQLLSGPGSLCGGRLATEASAGRNQPSAGACSAVSALSLPGASAVPTMAAAIAARSGGMPRARHMLRIRASSGKALSAVSRRPAWSPASRSQRSAVSCSRASVSAGVAPAVAAAMAPVTPWATRRRRSAA